MLLALIYKTSFLATRANSNGRPTRRPLKKPLYIFCRPHPDFNAFLFALPAEGREHCKIPSNQGRLSSSRRKIKVKREPLIFYCGLCQFLEPDRHNGKSLCRPWFLVFRRIRITRFPEGKPSASIKRVKFSRGPET